MSSAASAALSDEHKARVRALAGDLPALWSDPATPQRERKRMIRLLIDDVTLHKTDAIDVHVRFRGGQTASLRLPIPPSSWQLHQTNSATLALVDALLDDHTDAEVAEALNRAGHRSGRGAAFTSHKIIGLRRDHGFASHRERLRARGLLTLVETAARLGVHTQTVTKWQANGLLVAYKANDKNELLYEPPTGVDPVAIIQQARRRGPNQRRPTLPPAAGGAA